MLFSKNRIMKNITLFITICLFVLAGCSKQKEISFNSQLLQKLVLSAMNGNISANDSLGNLIDFTLPFNSSYNKFEIDSVVLNQVTYYTVLAEFPNPLYNRFAVYDNYLNNFLIDRSLNGYIKIAPIHVNNLKFFKVEEQFISKDIFRIERLSLYLIEPESVNLSFRIFTNFERPKEIYKQTVSEISEDRIKTELSSSAFSILSNKSDVFSFNDKQNDYKSSSEIFYNFVTEQIGSFSDSTLKPILTNETSGAEILDEDFANDVNNIFTISVTSEWKRIDNLKITENLSTQFTGTRYLNNKLGAEISIIKLPEGTAAEDFLNAELTNKNDGLNSTRYSNNIETGKDLIQYYEYSCGSIKFLMIIKVSKYTYENYKDHYNNIINSFKVNC